MIDLPDCQLAATLHDARTAWHDILADGGDIGFDTEYSGPTVRTSKSGKEGPIPHEAQLTGFSLSVGDRAWYFPVRHDEGDNLPALIVKAILEELVRIVEDGKRRVWCHNVAAELQILKNEGFLSPLAPSDNWYDSMVAAWLAYTLTGRDLGAKPLGTTLLDLPELPGFEDVAKGRQARMVPIADMVRYAATDAWLTKEIGKACWPRLEKYNLVEHFRELDMPLVEVVRGMQAQGLDIDLPAAAALMEDYGSRRDAAAKAFEELTTTEVLMPVKEKIQVGWFKNGKPKMKTQEVDRPMRLGCQPGNSPMVSRWLFDELKWWPTAGLERCKTGTWPVDAKTLEPFVNLPGPGGEAARLRSEFQKYDKLCSTYLIPFQQLTATYADGRVHPSYNLTGTRTQRFSSNGPNFQNIPVRSEAGKELRRCVVAPPGYKFIVFDYSQMEFRIMAEFSGCRKLIEAYDWGSDMHTKTAEELGIPRAHAKTVNLAVIYGVTAPSLAAKIPGLTPDAAQGMIDRLYERYPEIKKYNEKASAIARKHGYAPTRGGYKSFLGPGRTFPDGSWSEDRKARNTPIQACNAEYTKRAMRNLWRRWVARGVYGQAVWLALSVHDELGAVAREDFIDEARGDMEAEMTDVGLSFRVPITVEGGVGQNWLEAK